MNDEFAPDRIKHLEMIQNVVSRLGGNSVLVKGWAITVAAALFGFALNTHRAAVALVAVVPIVAFWLLDTYFLRAERLFRALYDEVRLGDEGVEPFYLGATGRKFVGRVREADTSCDNRTAASWWLCARSLTLLILYLGLLLATALVAAIAFASASSDDHHSHQPDANRYRFERHHG
jgi:hypothetical protein